ncbi:galactosylceramide sulfotransferase-like [Oppia nitens]|uniref:galactosylceramide sulfotransferase-like n=1 Tax=Oppia nitens TaxID=1686743 RepID=UPI0023DB9D29|nr:galactosylceramide sulfotransferase-like [Oppia nitens]
MLLTEQYFSKSYLYGCRPHVNVVFMKTHKTGSTCIQNIFLRYSDSHDLLIAVPITNGYFGHPDLFRRQFVPKLKANISYNMIASHMRFNYEELKAMMSLNTKFVTILRHPNTLFESVYSYYNLKLLFNVTYDDFLKYLYTNTTNGKNIRINSRLHQRFGRNQMSFDLGLNVTQFENNITINKFIDKLEKHFDLVLINERMDESLILLRQELCWTLNDVIVFKLNARKDYIKQKRFVMIPFLVLFPKVPYIPFSLGIQRQSIS